MALATGCPAVGSASHTCACLTDVRPVAQVLLGHDFFGVWFFGRVMALMALKPYPRPSIPQSLKHPVYSARGAPRFQGGRCFWGEFGLGLSCKPLS